MSLQEIREHINSRPMLAWQWLVVALGVLVNMLDGFDLLAASLVAPILTREWHLQHDTLGFLLSAERAGHCIRRVRAVRDCRPVGSPHRHPDQSRPDERGHAGVLAPQVPSELLVAMRFLTGMGVGAMAGCVGALDIRIQRRAHPQPGAGHGGGRLHRGRGGRRLLRPTFLGQFGWGALFVLGGALTLVLIPIIYFVMPESLEFLASKPRSRHTGAVQSLPAPLRLPPVDAAARSRTPKVAAVQRAGICCARPSCRGRC